MDDLGVAPAWLDSWEVGPQARFLRLDARAILPTRGSAGAAGFDLYACLDEPLPLQPDVPVLISTGWACKPPAGCFISLRERSGLGSRGIRVGAGVVDEDYRGEIKVSLMYLTRDSRPHPVIQPGDRIAQAIFQPYLVPTVSEVSVLDETERAQSGLGSSGR